MVFPAILFRLAQLNRIKAIWNAEVAANGCTSYTHHRRFI